MSIPVALAISLLLLIANGFFVAAEFAVIAAKQSRLQTQAEGGSGAAKAALANSRELSLMLASAQLGITICTLGLGALAKPAVKDLLKPLFSGLGAPDGVASVISLLLAVGVVVFLHMVVGEMAPKSWAISHPEQSALLLARPFRLFTNAFRWALRGLNAAANGLVRLAGVNPVDSVGNAQGPVELQRLISQSREHGSLADGEHDLLAGALRLEHETLREVMVPWDRVVTVPLSGSAADAERISADTGRSRLVVLDDGEAAGLVHIREVLVTGDPVREVVHAIETIDAEEHLIDALTAMRARRAHLALVSSGGGIVGITALEDLIEEVVGRFDDESDRAAS